MHFNYQSQIQKLFFFYLLTLILIFIVNYLAERKYVESSDIHKITFNFTIKDYKHSQNIFQTDYENKGVRLEVSRTGFSELIYHDKYYGIKHCVFIEKLLINKEYSFELYYNKVAQILFAKIDDGLVCLVSGKGLAPSFNNIIFGTGGWKNRYFLGIVDNIYIFEYNLN